MTIDEAIIHAREVAECRKDMCEECRAEHQQLAEWLEELKCYQEQHNIICDFYEVATVEELYNRAIDDAINEIVSVRSEVAEKEPYDVHLFTVLVQRQNEIVDLIQKLKVGGKNEGI